VACLAIIYMLFGGVPKDRVDVPASKLQSYSQTQIEWAKMCAARHGIRYKIWYNR
jgi:hypothetical protein